MRRSLILLLLMEWAAPDSGVCSMDADGVHRHLKEHLGEDLCEEHIGSKDDLRIELSRMIDDSLIEATGGKYVPMRKARYFLKSHKLIAYLINGVNFIDPAEVAPESSD